MEENIEILEGFIGRLNQDVYFDETTSFEYLKQPIENVLKELETYKKIAEKLADKGEFNHDNYCESNIFTCNAKTPKKTCKEYIIDWAKREVEKNV